MASNVSAGHEPMCGFQYMDEDSIDDELKCSICTAPFFDPGTIWTCDHAFCQNCINEMPENNKVCPLCRTTERQEFRPATRNFVSMLNKILVQCEYCNQVNIERGNFSEHINKLCPKFVVHCPAGGNSCTWAGPRDQLKSHLTQCTAELRKSLFTQFEAITKQIKQLHFNVEHIILQPPTHIFNEKLKSGAVRHDQHCQKQENDNEQLKLQLSQLDQQSESLKQRIPPLQITAPVRLINIHPHITWTQNGHRVAGGNNPGNEMHQLRDPYGFCIDDDQVMYIADSTNGRIVKWRCGATSGQVVAGGNGKGDGLTQLNSPTDVIVDKITNSLIICDYKNRRVVRWPLQGGTRGEIIISNVDCHGLVMDENRFLYVTDYQRNEVRRYRIGEPHGIVVAGGNGKGNRLDQLNGPIYVFVGRDNSVYVSDEQNHRVMKWRKGSKEGVVVAGGRAKGDGLEQLSGPAKVVVSPWNTVYVADWGNHRIMRWEQEATHGHVVVDKNSTERQLKHPISLTFDQYGNLYIANQWNHEILKYDIKQNL